jgi:hypothetical protein
MPWIPILIALGAITAAALGIVQWINENKKDQKIEEREKENKKLAEENKRLSEKAYKEIQQSNAHLMDLSEDLNQANKKIIELQSQSIQKLTGTGFPIIRHGIDWRNGLLIIFLENDQLLPINFIEVTFPTNQPCIPVEKKDGYYYEQYQSIHSFPKTVVGKFMKALL